MSSTRVIFTYKRKRLSSCSGVGHADICPDFSADVQVGKDQPGHKEKSESTEKDIMDHYRAKKSTCSSAQLHDSCGAKDKDPVKIFDTHNSREILLGNNSSEEEKCRTPGEYISSEASSQDARNTININSCLDLDSTGLLADGGIQGSVVLQSVEEPNSLSEQRYMSNIQVAKSKLTGPLLTFSRRLKRKTDLGGTVVLEELPTKKGDAASGERKSTCKSSCFCDKPSNVLQLSEKSENLKVANDDAFPMNSSKMTDKESRDPSPCTRTGSDIPVLRHTEIKSCFQDDLVLDSSPLHKQNPVKISRSMSPAFTGPDAPKTINLQKHIVLGSSNDEVLSSCDNHNRTDEQRPLQQAQTSSGGSQLTSSESSDVKRCAGKVIQQTVSSAPLNLSGPPTGAFVIDCNVIPESDVQEIESNFVQHSSAIVDNCGKVVEEVHLKKRKGLELFADNDLKVVQSTSSHAADLHSDHALFAAEKIPKTKCLQLFSEDGQSSLSAPTSKSTETGCSRAQQNAAFPLGGGKDQLEPGATKPSALLGLSLAMEPVYEGQMSQCSSGVHLFQDRNVGFREFIQNPLLYSFPDHSSLMLRHKALLERSNTRATALRGNRNISLDRFESCATMWSEEELDSLWIGIRRHGRGNWHAMLLDPRLCFAPWRVARDLADQWEREQYRLLSGQQMPADRSFKPRDMYGSDCHSHSIYPKAGFVREKSTAETQLSLGDVYARKGRCNSRRKVQTQAHMHVTVASKLGNYSCSSYNSVKTSAMIGDGPPDMALAPNIGIPHWLREPNGTSSRLFEPLHPHMSTQLQTEGLQPVHPFPVPSGTSSGQRNLNIDKFPIPAAENSGSSMRKLNTANKPIVVESDASSEETISDDNNIRN